MNFDPASLDLIYNWASYDKDAGPVQVDEIMQGGKSFLLARQDDNHVVFSTEDNDFGERFAFATGGVLVPLETSGVGWPD